jgi:ABC-type taurine transport system ATPase subunit
VHLAILVTNKVDEAVIVASQKQSVSVAGISGRVVCAYLLSREAPMIGARKVEDHD